jgi:hypothetical protein
VITLVVRINGKSRLRREVGELAGRKVSGNKQMNSARKKNGFTQSPFEKGPKTMAGHRSKNGFLNSGKK